MGAVNEDSDVDQADCVGSIIERPRPDLRGAVLRDTSRRTAQGVLADVQHFIIGEQRLSKNQVR